MARGYSQQVNRHIIFARFLLNKNQELSKNLNPVEQQALLNSAQLQFYFAVVAYLHELLNYYHRSSPSEHKSNLAFLYLDQGSPLLSIPEFALLQQWSCDRGDILKRFSGLLDALVFPETDGGDKTGPQTDKKITVTQVDINSKEKETDGGLNLIASDTQSPIDMDNIQDLLMLLSDFELLIDHQRENQSEY